MNIETAAPPHACLQRVLRASVFPRLEGQAGLPLEERFKFLLNMGQHLMAKNAGRSVRAHQLSRRMVRG